LAFRTHSKGLNIGLSTINTRMGNSLVSSVDRMDIDTSKTLLASILTTASYDSTNSICLFPVCRSFSEKSVNKQLGELTGLAKITTPYKLTNKNSSPADDVVRVHGRYYECTTIPETYVGPGQFSLDQLLAIPNSDIVGIRNYIFNPFDENGCKEFDLTFNDDMNSLNFCNWNRGIKFGILIPEAFRDQKRLRVVNEDPISVYALFVDHKPSNKYFKETKINGNSDFAKSIYLLHCTADIGTNKYNHRNHITH